MFLCSLVLAKFDLKGYSPEAGAVLLEVNSLHLPVSQDRRRIEHQAFSGQLLGIIATNALELGIDIGALDAVIMLGFPMTMSNFASIDSWSLRSNTDQLNRSSNRAELGDDLKTPSLS